MEQHTPRLALWIDGRYTTVGRCTAIAFVVAAWVIAGVLFATLGADVANAAGVLVGVVAVFSGAAPVWAVMLAPHVGAARA